MDDRPSLSAIGTEKAPFSVPIANFYHSVLKNGLFPYGFGQNYFTTHSPPFAGPFRSMSPSAFAEFGEASAFYALLLEGVSPTDLEQRPSSPQNHPASTSVPPCSTTVTPSAPPYKTTLQHHGNALQHLTNPRYPWSNARHLRKVPGAFAQLTTLP